MSDKQSEAQKARPSTLAELANLTLPRMDLVGPTVDDDIRRAIWRYGADAVKKAVKEATKAKRGRKREPDWTELREIIEADARDWLAGYDPFATRSNYAIAKEISERSPGHSVVSTHKRIERKLSRGPFDRRWYTLMSAQQQSKDAGPYMGHLLALKALSKLPESASPGIWKPVLDRALATINDYKSRENSLPPEEMTFREVEEAVQKGGLAALIAPPQPRGLFGGRSEGQGLLGSILSNAVDPAKE